ncbi:hypothetical protein HMPREF1982_01219 [Clostridiales bacterium oral taxon 876 str. F0540]|nr:hypothetical protein HMPREF1982_01219 [Clostridiales bacterium oral taxon 876 str. F0540]
MGYNAIDLINKAINITNRKRTIYESLEQRKCNIPAVKIMSKALIKEIDRTIQYYEELKNEVEPEEIDFYIYDKMSFLIDEFNKKIIVTEINNIKDYLKFSLDLEKRGKSVLIDVQGRFVRNKSDINTKTYKILSDMINNKEKLITTLEKIMEIE